VIEDKLRRPHCRL